MRLSVSIYTQGQRLGDLELLTTTYGHTAYTPEAYQDALQLAADACSTALGASASLSKAYEHKTLTRATQENTDV